MVQLRFSIIIPAYNCDDTIKRAVNSVLKQNFQNYEIILINDGSSDKTKLIIDNFDDAKIISIIFKENRGIGAARNAGINRSIGEYILFLDSDDELEQNALVELNKIISKLKFKPDRLLWLSKVYKNSKLIHSGKKLIKKRLLSFEDIYTHKIISHEGGTCINRCSLGSLRFDEKLCRYGNESLFWVLYSKNKYCLFINKHFLIIHKDSKTNTRKVLNMEKSLNAGIALSLFEQNLHDLWLSKKLYKELSSTTFLVGWYYLMGGRYFKGIKFMFISFKYEFSFKRLLILLISLFGPYIYYLIRKFRVIVNKT